MRSLQSLKNKKVGIIGFGREGRSTYEHIKHLCDEIVIFDANYENIKESIQSEKVCVVSDTELANYSHLDTFFKSPGVPYKNIENVIDRKKITSQTNEFLKSHRDKIIGITGTKGKSTTSTMIYELLKNYGLKVQLVGNIGIPTFEASDDNDYFVVEMSSHQLELVDVSPKYAVLLNVFEEHLDHYKSFEHYKRAKQNIYRFQQKGDLLFSYELPDETINSTFFDISNLAKGNVLVDLSHYKNVVGVHNKNNGYVAMLVATQLGYSDIDVTKTTFENFKGLRHRLEFIGSYDGIDYYDDSISTIPKATILGASSIDNIYTVIIGGMDRNIDYSLLEKFIVENEQLKFIALPNTGHKIARNIKAENIYEVDGLEKAVKVAKDITPKGKAVLLSPAAPSYGFFKNFEERGDKFRDYVARK